MGYDEAYAWLESRASTLSIPFMGYLCMLMSIQSKELNFQFPLWDTQNHKIVFLNSTLNVFQFPLWDTYFHLKNLKKNFLPTTFNSLYGIRKSKNVKAINDQLTFNSLYGIHIKAIRDMIEVIESFQFPLWDTYKLQVNPEEKVYDLSIPFMGYILNEPPFAGIFILLSIPFMGYHWTTRSPSIIYIFTTFNSLYGILMNNNIWKLSF